MADLADETSRLDPAVAGMAAANVPQDDTVIDLPPDPITAPVTGAVADEDDEANPWKRPSPSDEIGGNEQEVVTKKRKVDVTQDSASRKRGQRMVSLLFSFPLPCRNFLKMRPKSRNYCFAVWRANGHSEQIQARRLQTNGRCNYNFPSFRPL